MNILAIKGPGGTKGVAQLWIIGKIECATLVVNQYRPFTVKLYFTNDDRNTLGLMLRKWGKFGKEWDPGNIESVVNFSTRLEKVEDLIRLGTGNEEVRDIVQAIHIQDTSLFTYDVRVSADVNGVYPDPKHNVDNFKARAGVAVEFQLLSRNFKASRKEDAVKDYSFRRLFGWEIAVNLVHQIDRHSWVWSCGENGANNLCVTITEFSLRSTSSFYIAGTLRRSNLNGSDSRGWFAEV